MSNSTLREPALAQIPRRRSQSKQRSVWHLPILDPCLLGIGILTSFAHHHPSLTEQGADIAADLSHALPLALHYQSTQFDLRLGDCVEGMKALEAGSVDVVVTSPPYNLGIAYSKYDDTAGRDDFLDWCVEWAAEVKRVMKDDASFFLNIGAAPKNPYLPHELLLRLRDLFVLQNTIHWIKSITVEPTNAPQVSAGHFKPINSKRYVNDCHEYVFHLTKAGNTELDRRAAGVPYQDKSNIARWGHTGGEDKRCRGNTWFVPYKTITSRDKERPHPATFPIELATRCFQLHGKRGDTIAMDPFLGIGHAALAARDYGAAKFIGFEIDEAYFAEAQRQVAASQGELDLS